MQPQSILPYFPVATSNTIKLTLAQNPLEECSTALPQPMDCFPLEKGHQIRY